MARTVPAAGASTTSSDASRSTLCTAVPAATAHMPKATSLRTTCSRCSETVPSRSARPKGTTSPALPTGSKAPTNAKATRTSLCADRPTIKAEIDAATVQHTLTAETARARTSKARCSSVGGALISGLSPDPANPVDGDGHTDRARRHQSGRTLSDTKTEQLALRPVRAMWLVLAVGAVAGATALLAFDHARAWHYFVDAAHLLVRDSEAEGGGLRVYRTHPEFQFGPLVILVSVPYAWLPESVGEWAVMVTASLAGVAALALGVHAVRIRHPDVEGRGRLLPLLVGVPFVALWLRLAAYTAHIDDVIALAAVAASGLAIERRRSGWTVVALTVAAAAKPWAIIFAPMAMLGDVRPRVERAVLVVVLSAATWLPFLVGSPGTLDALRDFAIGVDVNSGLRTLQLDEAATPAWVRPAQLALGFAATTIAVLWRRSWPAAFVAGIAARMLIDPATEHYYTTGLVLAALVWELDRWPGRLPWRTALIATVLEIAASDVTLGGLMATIRFVVLAGTIAVVLATAETGRSSFLGASGEGT